MMLQPLQFPDLPASRVHTGIGSRATPPDTLELIAKIATALARAGLTLRSGGAPGADAAFEAGAGAGSAEIFLPWKGFNHHPSLLYSPPSAAFDLARTVHPRWERCKPAHRLFHARNCQQVLGKALDDPVDFVLFWAREEEGQVGGGTATAVRLARKRGIATFNLWREEVRALWCRELSVGI